MKPPFDILTFGSITMDLFLRPQEIDVIHGQEEDYFQIPIGEKIAVESSQKLMGGGSANVAVGLAKLGLKAAAFGVVGDGGNQYFLYKEFEKYGIDTSFLTTAKGYLSSFSVVLNSPEGERTVFHQRTTSPDFCAKVLESAPFARALHLGHLYKGAPETILSQAPKWKERCKGLLTWNPGNTQFKKGFDAFKEVFPHVDLLILNRKETECFTQKKAQPLETQNATPEEIGVQVSLGMGHVHPQVYDVRSLAKRFQDAGVHTVVITDGKRGAQVFAPGGHYFAPALQCDRVDTLGAGDAFTVGMIGARLQGQDLVGQILWAGSNAASVISQIGAQPGQLTLEQIQK